MDADDLETEVSAKPARDANGYFAKGNKLAAGHKGHSITKKAQAICEAVWDAFWELGGIDLIRRAVEKEGEMAFLHLLCKYLPRQFALDVVQRLSVADVFKAQDERLSEID